MERGVLEGLAALSASPRISCDPREITKPLHFLMYFTVSVYVKGEE